MNRLFPAGAILALLLLAAPARAQSATRVFIGGSAGILGGIDESDRSGVALGGTIGAYRPDAVGPIALRVEASLARVWPVQGDPCSLEVGGGPCRLPGTTGIGGAMVGLVTPVRSATRPFASVGVGAYHRTHETGSGITSGALSAGVGFASMQRGRSGGIELRAIWLPGGEQAVLFPLSLSVVF